MTWSNYQAFYDWLWDESIWLPKITSWKNIKANRLPIIEDVGGLYLCIPITILMMVLRYIFERYIASPFVQWLGVKIKPPAKVSPNTACEHAFKKSKKPSHQKVLELSEHLGWSTKEVQRWFRLRQRKDQPSVLTKATECSWRFLFYFCVTIYGTLTLGKYKCLYHLESCFTDFKTHVLHIDLYVYYLAEISMYLALSISQFTDVKRKDFLQNLIHHILTLILLTYSVISGHYHLGAIIVFVHDISDVFLEAAKVFHYAKLQKMCDAFFVVFAVVFYISRLYVLPFWVFCGIYYAHEIHVQTFLVYRIMFYFLLVLQVLHVYWAYCIGIIVHRALIGKGVTDSRSEGEDETDPELTNDHTVPLENKKEQ